MKYSRKERKFLNFLQKKKSFDSKKYLSFVVLLLLLLLLLLRVRGAPFSRRS